MPDGNQSPIKTLAARAIVLSRRAQELRGKPMMAQANEAPELVENMAALMVEMASQIEALTPYIDEDGAA